MEILLYNTKCIVKYILAYLEKKNIGGSIVDVIKTLSDIIKIDTTNPPGNEKDITRYIMDRYEGYENLTEIDNGDNRASLVVDIPGESDETVAFVGHIDTVPVSDASVWKYPPFDAHIEGDLIYGRGTSDMKSGAACMIALGDYFIKNDKKPDKNIRLIFTADEEATGKGVLSVMEKGYLDDVDFVIVPENTSSDVVLKEKGALWLSLELFGKAAHGARPDLGINSIEIVYELVEDLKSFVEVYCNDDLLGDSTISLNKISGGKSTNIIADYCKAEIDVRANPDLQNSEVIEYLEKQIYRYEHKYEGLKIKFEELTNRPSLEMDRDNKFVEEFVKNLDDLEMDYDYAGVTYFTDLSLTIPKIDTPFVIFGPGFIDKGHQVDECASVKAIQEASEMFIQYLK